MRCIVATVQTEDCAWLVAEDQETYLGSPTEQMLTSDEGYARHDTDEVTRFEIDDFDVDPTSAAEDGLCGSLFEDASPVKTSPTLTLYHVCNSTIVYGWISYLADGWSLFCIPSAWLSG